MDYAAPPRQQQHGHVRQQKQTTTQAECSQASKEQPRAEVANSHSQTQPTEPEQVGKCIPPSVLSKSEIDKLVIGGRLRSYSHVWEKYTSDQYILSTVSGYKIEFINKAPYQPFSNIPRPYKLNEHEIEAIDNEIIKLQQKGVIEHTVIEHDQYVSNNFTRPKKDGGYRMILDLSYLNDDVQYKKFKLENFQMHYL